MDPVILSSCFDVTEDAEPHSLYDLLGRDQINATRDFLDCSGFRIFLLAGVFKWDDYRLISSTEMFVDANRKGPAKEAAAAHYMRSVVSANVFGAPQFMVEEFVVATFSKTLAEACSKTKLSYRKLLGWKNRICTPELKDLDDIRHMASVMDMGTPIVMGGLGLLREDDFLLNGQPVDLQQELKAALDVEIW